MANSRASKNLAHKKAKAKNKSHSGGMHKMPSGMMMKGSEMKKKMGY